MLDSFYLNSIGEPLVLSLCLICFE